MRLTLDKLLDLDKYQLDFQVPMPALGENVQSAMLDIVFKTSASIFCSFFLG